MKNSISLTGRLSYYRQIVLWIEYHIRTGRLVHTVPPKIQLDTNFIDAVSYFSIVNAKHLMAYLTLRADFHFKNSTCTLPFSSLLHCPQKLMSVIKQNKKLYICFLNNLNCKPKLTT